MLHKESVEFRRVGRAEDETLPSTNIGMGYQRRGLLQVLRTLVRFLWASAHLRCSAPSPLDEVLISRVLGPS